MLKVHMEPGMHMKISEGDYEILLGGWQFATKDVNICWFNVGLVVKASGIIPGGPQKPPSDSHYGRNRRGWQPPVLQFPIAHRDYHLGLDTLMMSMKRCWEAGQSVLFHCNRGEVQAPAAVCSILRHCTGISGLHWLGKVIAVRKVDNLLVDMHHQVSSVGNQNWIPGDYRSFVIVWRIWNYAATVSDFRAWFRENYGGDPPRDRYVGQTPPGTPRSSFHDIYWEDRQAEDDGLDLTPRVANPRRSPSPRPRVANPLDAPCWNPLAQSTDPPPRRPRSLTPPPPPPMDREHGWGVQSPRQTGCQPNTAGGIDDGFILVPPPPGCQPNFAEPQAGCQPTSATFADLVGGHSDRRECSADDAADSQLTFGIPLGYSVDNLRPNQDRWDENPRKLCKIHDQSLSIRLTTFLLTCHDKQGYNRNDDLWRYDKVSGFHPCHTVVDVFRSEKRLEEFFAQLDRPVGLTTLDLLAWKTNEMAELWCEMLRHGIAEYGSVDMRTHSDLPANNTPLMLAAKARFKYVSSRQYGHMMSSLVEAGGDLGAVDNRKTNAFMMACGHGNEVFVDFVFARAKMLFDSGEFDFNQLNVDDRNAMGMVAADGAKAGIRNKLFNLAQKEYMDMQVDNRFHGSSAYRRDRSLPAARGTRRYETRYSRNRAWYDDQGYGPPTSTASSSSSMPGI